MIELLNTSSAEWNYYIEKLPLHLKDIYFRSEYYNLYENNKDKVGKIFIFKERENLAIYPFLLSKINDYDLKKQYYDMETAYGYGGPLVNTDNEEFIHEFEKEFKKFCNKNNIIAEFIRFHPLLNNHTIFKDNINVSHNRTTTYIDLNKSIYDIWNKDITSKNRNVIRKAEKNKLITEVSFDLKDFKKIYINTMDRLNANKEYYFKDYYFNNLRNLNYICINVKLNNVVIASAVFLRGNEMFHYHLSGSLKDYLKYCPNNLLLWEAIKYAKDKGFSKFHFGGGLKDSENDTLYKFKKSFCNETSDFYIGKRIHNEKIYDYLINQWKNKTKKQPVLFLQYKEMI